MTNSSEYWVMHRYRALMVLVLSFALGLVFGMAFGVLLFMATTT